MRYHVCMATEQTLWVQQWARYSEMAKSQDAPPEFWIAYKKISIPANGQITESQIIKLKELMANYKLHL